jgi:hypothetical protein
MANWTGIGSIVGVAATVVVGGVVGDGGLRTGRSIVGGDGGKFGAFLVALGLIN